MNKAHESDRKPLAREVGPSFVEYSLLVTLLGVACLVTVSFMGTSLKDIFAQVAAAV